MPWMQNSEGFYYVSDYPVGETILISSGEVDQYVTMPPSQAQIDAYNLRQEQERARLAEEEAEIARQIEIRAAQIEAARQQEIESARQQEIEAQQAEIARQIEIRAAQIEAARQQEIESARQQEIEAQQAEFARQQAQAAEEARWRPGYDTLLKQMQAIQGQTDVYKRGSPLSAETHMENIARSLSRDYGINSIADIGVKQIPYSEMVPITISTGENEYIAGYENVSRIKNEFFNKNNPSIVIPESKFASTREGEGYSNYSLQPVQQADGSTIAVPVQYYNKSGLGGFVEDFGPALSAANAILMFGGVPPLALAAGNVALQAGAGNVQNIGDALQVAAPYLIPAAVGQLAAGTDVVGSDWATSGAGTAASSLPADVAAGLSSSAVGQAVSNLTNQAVTGLAADVAGSAAVSGITAAIYDKDPLKFAALGGVSALASAAGKSVFDATGNRAYANAVTSSINALAETGDFERAIISGGAAGVTTLVNQTVANTTKNPVLGQAAQLGAMSAITGQPVSTGDLIGLGKQFIDYQKTSGAVKDSSGSSAGTTNTATGGVDTTVGSGVDEVSSETLGTSTSPVTNPNITATLPIGAASAEAYNKTLGEFNSLQSEAQGKFNEATEFYNNEFKPIQDRRSTLIGQINAGLEERRGYLAKYYDINDPNANRWGDSIRAIDPEINALNAELEALDSTYQPALQRWNELKTEVNGYNTRLEGIQNTLDTQSQVLNTDQSTVDVDEDGALTYTPARFDIKNLPQIVEAGSMSQAVSDAQRISLDDSALRSAPKELQRVIIYGSKSLPDSIKGFFNTAVDFVKSVFATGAVGLGEQIQYFSNAYSMLTGTPLDKTYAGLGKAMELWGNKNITVPELIIQNKNYKDAMAAASKMDFRDAVPFLVKKAFENPLGFTSEVSKELVQEVVPTAAGLAFGVAARVLIGGPVGTVMAARALGSAVVDGLETFGANGKEAENQALKEGKTPNEARIIGIYKGAIDALVTIPSEYLGDKSTFKAVFEGINGGVKGMAAKYGSAIGAQGTGEFFETVTQCATSWYASDTKEPFPLNSCLVQGWSAAMIAGGTTAGVVGISDAKAIVAKDMAGKDVTLGEMISGQKLIDAKTLNPNAVISTSSNGTKKTLGSLTAVSRDLDINSPVLSEFLPQSMLSNDLVIATLPGGTPVTIADMNRFEESGGTPQTFMSSLSTANPVTFASFVSPTAAANESQFATQTFFDNSVAAKIQGGLNPFDATKSVLSSMNIPASELNLTALSQALGGQKNAVDALTTPAGETKVTSGTTTGTTLTTSPVTDTAVTDSATTNAATSVTGGVNQAGTTNAQSAAVTRPNVNTDPNVNTSSNVNTGASNVNVTGPGVTGPGVPAPGVPAPGVPAPNPALEALEAQIAAQNAALAQQNAILAEQAAAQKAAEEAKKEAEDQAQTNTSMQRAMQFLNPRSRPSSNNEIPAITAAIIGGKSGFVSPLEAFSRMVQSNQYVPQQQQPEGALMQASPYAYGKQTDLNDIFGIGDQDDEQVEQTAKAGGLMTPLMAAGGTTRYGKFASGGLNVVHHAGKMRVDFRRGDAVTGAGDGQSDDIPAMLADGEFVIPADVVAALGNGSTKAGSDALYEMMHSIRARARKGHPKSLPPPAKSPLDYISKRK
jgi:hypothetical protein